MSGARVFVSYRREDASGHAGRVYDGLEERFGRRQVFMDVDALEPGVDFVEHIETAVARTDVLVAVIGPRWLDARDANGARRLDAPEDFVRVEVAAALSRGIRVIPVLVGGTPFPPEAQLPPPLKGLARRNALVLSDLDWASGMRRLIAAIDSELDPPRRPRALAPVLGALGAALLLLGTALRWDAIVSPDFGGGTVPNLGLATAPGPLAVAAGALLAAALLAASARPWLDGLLLGVAVAGVAKYAGVVALGLRSDDEGWADRNGPLLAAALALAGAAALAAFAWARISARPDRRRAALDPGATVLALAGGALVLAATALPFNLVGPERAEAVLLRREGGLEAIDPIVLAVAAIALALLGGRAGRDEAGGALVGLGLLAALLWVRYVGVPLLQAAHADDLAAVQAGGFVGLAGALLVAGAGLRLRAAGARGPALDAPRRIAGA